MNYKKSLKQYWAFLNVPYDNQYKNLYLAFIAGLSAFGLIPRATLEIPGSQRRLDLIFKLIKDCHYSFHDLSRVQLDSNPPPTPRFNMPFELGIAITLAKIKGGNAYKNIFVFEEVKWRINKSLSDLEGTHVYIHDGTVKGVFRELSNALINVKRQPTLSQIQFIYRDLKKSVPRIVKETKSLFKAKAFHELYILARKYSEEYR
jgi:hypothetical protein